MGAALGEPWMSPGSSDKFSNKLRKFMREKKTITEFIEEAIIKHNNKYNYLEFEYINYKTKGIIICPIHGKFSQSPSNHLYGFGCRRCGEEIIRASRVSCVEFFIEKANITHNYKFNYINFIYKNNSTPSFIICPTHGSFKQSAANHLKGQGCPKCGQEIKRQKRAQPQNEFIKRASEKHGQYIYDEVKYINARTKVDIICSVHGKFSQMPYSHLSGCGCPKCFGHILKTREELLEQMNKLHNYFYTYCLEDYKNGDTKITIICPKHGEFKQTPEHHLRGYGCRKCGHMVSKKSQKWLDGFNNPNIIRECVLTINNKRYNTDGFDKITNTVYEFYGDLWHGNPKRHCPDDKIFYGKTFGQLYSKTIKREAELKKAGYNVIIIWEDDFDKQN